VFTAMAAQDYARWAQAEPPVRREDPKWKFVQVRSSQYLNNLIGAPGKVWRFQRVKIPHRQGASHPTGNRALGLWR